MGIEIDLDNENNHVKFKNLRNFNDDHYDEFWSLQMEILKICDTNNSIIS